jgi:hypothetical protein
VGQLVDPSSTDQVRAAITNLTKAWGGIFSPILDIRLSFESLNHIAENLDVDALHTDIEDDEVVGQLRKTGWLWRGRGPYGPFSTSDSGLHIGVLPAGAIAKDHGHLVLPRWRKDDPLDFFFTVVFGTTESTDELALVSDSNGGMPTQVDVDDLLTMPDIRMPDVGAINATGIGVSLRSAEHQGPEQVIVIPPNNGEDAVNFWNLRATGARITPIPADGPPALLSFLTRGLSSVSPPTGQPEDHQGQPSLLLWGVEHASAATSQVIQETAARLGTTAIRIQGSAGSRIGFPGLETAFGASVRADFAANARAVTVTVPVIPLKGRAHQVMPGVVGVEIRNIDVQGLDPRLVAVPPADRRCSEVLQRLTDPTNLVRVNQEGDGLVLGIQARSDEVTIGFAYHLDVIQAYFDDPDIKVSQSDEGRFQTRAAEMLGGPFADVTLQPGVRAVLQKASRS